MLTYKTWISNYRFKHKYLAGACGSATLEMCKTFPELKRIPGHVVLASGHKVEHWWCEDNDGNIIDPTVGQWALLPAEYIPWVPGDEVCVGKCMNCGNGIYDTPATLNGIRRSVCSNECERELMDSLRA